MLVIKIRNNQLIKVFMANVIKLRKGLDINLKGTACKETISTLSGEYALVPIVFVELFLRLLCMKVTRLRLVKPCL